MERQDDDADVLATTAHLEGLRALLNDDLPRAKECLEDALRHGLAGPDATKARLRLASLSFHLRDQDHAVALCERMLQEEPAAFSDPDARTEVFFWLDLAWSLKSSAIREFGGTLLDALEYLHEREALLARVPGQYMPHFHFELGAVYFALKRVSDAARAWKTCVEAEVLYPADVTAQDTLDIKARGRAALRSVTGSAGGVRDAGGSGCWIATAAYGPDSGVTNRLREFRDRVLLRTRIGLRFVEHYYRWSPAIAARMEHSVALKLLLRYSVVLPAFWVATVVLRSFPVGHPPEPSTSRAEDLWVATFL